MTDKELHRLSRHDLLELMLASGREAEQLRERVAEMEAQIRQLENTYERLRNRLDQKDAQIHQLRDLLQEERTKREIELEDAGSIAEAALRLNGVFEAAQKAAEQYVYNVRRMQERQKRHKSAAEPNADEKSNAQETEYNRQRDVKGQRNGAGEERDRVSDAQSDRSGTAEGKA